MQTQHSILLADTQPLFRDAFTHLIQQVAPDCQVQTTSHLKHLNNPDQLESSPTHLIMDINFYPGVQMAILPEIRSRFPNTLIGVLSDKIHHDLIAKLAQHGVQAFFSRMYTQDQLIKALKQFMNGQEFTPKQIAFNPAQSVTEYASLTPRQRKVLFLIGEGKLNKEIAHELDIAETTVKAHVSAVLRKLHVHNRTQAVIVAHQYMQHQAPAPHQAYPQ